METINLKVAIICVLERYPLAVELRNRIESDNVKIITDVTRSGSWTGTRNAWSSFETPDTHLLALEEDVDICKDFYATCLKILKIQPDKIISLFNFRSDKRLNLWAQKNNSHWATFNAGSSGQAVIMPKNKVIDFLKFDRKFIAPAMPYEDTRLWGFTKIYGHKVWVTIPNIVEHTGAMNSALGFNNAGKVSYDFIGNTQSGLDIDWTQGIDKAEIHPFNNDWEGWSKWYTPEFFKGKINHV